MTSSHDETRSYGDGINVAARLEALAAPGGVLVSHAVHEQVRDRLALAFEDLGERELKNIARPVRVYRLQAPGKPTAAPAPAATLTLPEKPSIAALPFDNMSGDPEQGYLADGIAEDTVTALSRLRWLFVIARNSSFTYKGRHVDIREVGRELGVRYVLEGSVRKGGNRIRVNAQLIEAATGNHLWAERYDRPLDDVFRGDIPLCAARGSRPGWRQASGPRALRDSGPGTWRRADDCEPAADVNPDRRATCLRTTTAIAAAS